MTYDLPEYNNDLSDSDYEARVKYFMQTELNEFRRKQAKQCFQELMKQNENITWQ